jgi:hypothetical protein
MTPEELDKARVDEAFRIWGGPQTYTAEIVGQTAARLAREGWTPPEPVDPDVLALKEWAAAQGVNFGFGGLVGAAFLAGARMAREQERKRRSGLVATMEALKHSTHRSTRIYADVALKLYNAGRADHD